MAICLFLQGGPPTSYTCSYNLSYIIYGLLNVQLGLFHPYKWSYSTLLITGFCAHLVFVMLNDGHMPWSFCWISFWMKETHDEQSDVNIYIYICPRNSTCPPPKKETISIGNEWLSNHWFSGEYGSFRGESRFGENRCFNLLPIFSSLNRRGQFWQIIHLNTSTMRFKDVLVFYFLFFFSPELSWEKWFPIFMNIVF